MAQSIFISHASDDAAVARQICAALESTGLSCWIAPRDIRAGADYRNEILRGIRETDAFLLVYSRKASESEHVAREVGYADERGKTVYPVRVDSTNVEGPLEYLLQGKQWVDFNANPEQAIRLVAEAVRGAPLANAPKVGVAPQRKRRLLIGALVAGMAIIGVGGFFGYRAWQGQQAVRQCDRLAGSELALDANAGPGVPFGMIQPGPALSACREALAARPNSARMRLNYARALAAATPAPMSGVPRPLSDALEQAAQVGSVEAVVALTKFGNEYELDVEMLNAAIAALSESALTENNPRAAYLLAELELPMCEYSSSENTPPSTPAPSVSEQAMWAWGRERFATIYPEQARLAQEAQTVAAFDALAQMSLCGFVEASLRARASAGGLAAAQLWLAADASEEDETIGMGDDIESRSPSDLLAAAVAQAYVPAEFYAGTRGIECVDEDGRADRVEAAQWRRLEALAERGYRPAMSLMATLIVTSCAPSNFSYADARRWLERAAEGMEQPQ
jgi:hypothetical protein